MKNKSKYDNIDLDEVKAPFYAPVTLNQNFVEDSSESISPDQRKEDLKLDTKI